MARILLVFTGGTIGSTVLNGTIDTSKQQRYHLIDLFSQRYSNSEQPHFKVIQPIQLLSENLFPSDWETLINAIEVENISQYDGIVVTHGTDTLAYTASALSLYFNAIKIPLLLVSSNYPLDNPLANGLCHFCCAIEFIKKRKEGGVFVPYKNPGAEILVHLGARLASCLQLSGDFISVQHKAYLRFERNVFQQLNPINTSVCSVTQLIPSFSPNIVLIRPYPGLDYSLFQLDQVKAIVHDLYHSGTACSSIKYGEDYSLVAFIKKCQQFDIDFYMAPAIKNTDSYASTKALIEQGAKMIWNMSIESAYVKLLLAYGNYVDNKTIVRFLESDIALEYIEESGS